jgi:hypothetical protein
VISTALHRAGCVRRPRGWQRYCVAAGLGVVLAVGYASAAGAAAVPAPSIAISPASYAYPVIAKGSSESKTFVVTNTGGAATAALSVSLSGRSVAVFHRTADACTAVSLGPQKSCTVTVVYQPATEGAADSVTLVVTSKKPSAQAIASLSGTSFGPPIANPDSYTASDDPVLTVSAPGVLANDSDPDGDTLSVGQVNGSAADVGTPVTLPSGAVLTVHQDGSFSYDPNGQFEGGGTDSFTYTVSDGHGDEATATVTITVTADGSPTANNVSYITSDNTVLTVGAGAGLLSTAVPFDADDTLSVAQVNGSAADVGTPVTLPSGALLTVHQDGSFSYDPNGNFAAGGTDSFTYTVSDGHGGEATATVTITVTASGNLSVSASLGSGVTLPMLNCTQVTLGDFSAVLMSSGGAIKTLPLAPIAPGSSTFGASFQNIPPGSYDIALQAPPHVSFTSAPPSPAAITISAGQEAQQAFTITAASSDIATGCGDLSVSASLDPGVTLPVLNGTQVTLGDFSAVLMSSGGAIKTLPLAPIAPGSSTFGASFQNIPPGSYEIALQAPPGMSFTSAPPSPVAITISAGQEAQQAFTITAASAP